MGSLPFLSVTAALDFNQEFDLPVLFTLPSLGQEHFMGFDVAFLLGILDGTDNKQKVQLKSKFYRTSNDIIPFFLSDFLQRQRGDAFKYQLIGPYTFFKILDEPMINFEQFCHFLITKYKNLIEMLQREGMTLFSLDEPLIGGLINESPNYRQSLCSFIEELKSHKFDLSVHVCSDIPVSLVKELPSKFNLDFSILSQIDKSYVDQTNIFGFSEGVCKLQDFLGENLPHSLDSLYASPSCGLYGVDEKKCYRVLSNLRTSKHHLIAAKSSCL